MLPFNSETKKMTVVVETGNGGVRVFTKGASENIIDDCAYIIGERQGVVNLDLNQRDVIKE